MFVVSYVIILAFHPKLNIDRVIIQRSVGHTLKQLTTLDYLTNDETPVINVSLVHQLRDCASEVVRKKCKNSLAQMFSVDLSFIKKLFCLGSTKNLSFKIYKLIYLQKTYMKRII